MKIFQVMLIAILFSGLSLSVKSMEPPAKVSKDLDERYLDAASDGNIQSIRKLLGTLPKNCPDIFAERNGKSALQLAVETAISGTGYYYWKVSPYWCEISETIQCIAESMIANSYIRGFEAMGIVFDWLNMRANSEDYGQCSDDYRSDRELAVRRLLTNILEDKVRKIKERRSEGLETAARYSVTAYRKIVEENARNQLERAYQIRQRAIHPIPPRVRWYRGNREKLEVIGVYATPLALMALILIGNRLSQS
jgi:hypothetical protein